MWFKLNTTFTTSLGKLSELTNSWPITRYLTNFTTASNILNVEKNGAYEAVFTIGANCTLDATPTVTMSGIAVSASQAVWNASAGTLTVKISSVTGPVVITASATKNSSTGGGGSEGGGETTDPTPDDTEIGTTTTFGSTNVEVTIIGTFSDFNFANKCVVSTASGSSCSLNTAGASGRISSPNQVLKVSGGETVTFNSSISGLQYALIEFTDKPCVHSTLNKSGQYGQGWTTNASMTLHSNTKYLAINFNNGSADMTSEQLESLKTAIVLS